MTRNTLDGGLVDQRPNEWMVTVGGGEFKINRGADLHQVKHNRAMFFVEEGTRKRARLHGRFLLEKPDSRKILWFRRLVTVLPSSIWAI